MRCNFSIKNLCCCSGIASAEQITSRNVHVAIKQFMLIKIIAEENKTSQITLLSCTLNLFVESIVLWYPKHQNSKSQNYFFILQGIL